MSENNGRINSVAKNLTKIGRKQFDHEPETRERWICGAFGHYYHQGISK
jgi:hypothetical protein